MNDWKHIFSVYFIFFKIKIKNQNGSIDGCELNSLAMDLLNLTKQVSIQ